MVQVLHGSAATTATIRRAIQHGHECLRALSKRYGINQKKVTDAPFRDASGLVRPCGVAGPPIRQAPPMHRARGREG